MDERSERIARFMDPFLMVAALLTLPAVTIHEAQTGTSLDAIAQGLNWATWLPFLIEVVVMLIVVPDRKRWLREHPIELVIVVLTPPVLPPGLQGLRVVRLLAAAALAATRPALAPGLLDRGPSLRGPARGDNSDRRRCRLRGLRALPPLQRLDRPLLGGHDDDDAGLQHLPDHHWRRDYLGRHAARRYFLHCRC